MNSEHWPERSDKRSCNFISLCCFGFILAPIYISPLVETKRLRMWGTSQNKYLTVNYTPRCLGKICSNFIYRCRQCHHRLQLNYKKQEMTRTFWHYRATFYQWPAASLFIPTLMLRQNTEVSAFTSYLWQWRHAELRVRSLLGLSSFQPGPLSLVEKCRGLALIGWKLHSVAPQALLCRAGSLWHKKAGVSNSWDLTSTSRWTTLWVMNELYQDWRLKTEDWRLCVCGVIQY